MPTTPKNCLHWLSKHSQQREHFHAKRQMAHNSDTSAERFPGACIVSLHCVRKCSSSLIDESCKPCCVSCTSRSRKLVYPNSTSSRHSEKSSSRLCREFWAMSLSSSSMWTVSLQNAKRKTISDDYSFLLHVHCLVKGCVVNLTWPRDRWAQFWTGHLAEYGEWPQHTSGTSQSSVFSHPWPQRDGMSYAKVNNERKKKETGKKENVKLSKRGVWAGCDSYSMLSGCELSPLMLHKGK